IAGNAVTFTPPLYLGNWQAGLSPKAFWLRAADGAVRSGVEDLTVDGSSGNAYYNIGFFAAQYCWVKNIESIKAQHAHVEGYQSLGIEVRDSYFHETWNYASDSYGVRFDGSSAARIENNLFHTVTSPLVANSSMSGIVFAYNYLLDMRYD